ncbi:MAG: hypothetical protein ACFCU6_11270, partial [Balneolaceae bacterium]
MISYTGIKKVVVLFSTLVVISSYFIYEGHSLSAVNSNNYNATTGVDHKNVCTTVFGSSCSSVSGDLCGTHVSGGTTYYCRAGN